MGKYLDRLNDEFDELTAGVTMLLERVADEGRDVNDEEQARIDRDDKRRDQLTKAIEDYTAIEEKQGKVAELRRKVGGAIAGPRVERVKEPEPAYEITREFPTAGHYAAAVHAAWVNKDPDALAAIDRVTAHQITGDNPGIIPRPIVGPLINTLSGARPLIASVPNRPAPAQKFDRPRVDQHVSVEKQTLEKTETASQNMLINPVAVSLETFAGHLNISKQDIRWSQPSILQVVFDDFTRMYGRRTDAGACLDFPAAILQSAALSAWTVDAVDAWLRAAFQTVLTNADDAIIDTVWMSTDVWSKLGGVRTVQGNLAFNLPIGGGGDVLGLRAVLDPHFAIGTLITGEADLAESWEDLEGFLSVDEPSVLGQLVGYAGYLDFVVVQPKGFVKASTVPAALASDVVFTEQTAMPANGTVEDTLAWVGTDKARAQQALAAENAKATPRTTLIGQLQQILAS